MESSIKRDVKEMGVWMWTALMWLMLTGVYATAVIIFREIAKTTVGFVMSVCPYGATRLSLDRFS